VHGKSVLAHIMIMMISVGTFSTECRLFKRALRERAHAQAAASRTFLDSTSRNGPNPGGIVDLKPIATGSTTICLQPNCVTRVGHVPA
jgi:hypothetical protein